MSWTMRAATADDLDAIMLIENAMFPTDAWETATMRAELASEHTRYLVVTPVEDPAVVVGYGGVLAPLSVADADIQTVAVVPEAQHQGIGRALMQHLAEEARLRGARTLFLEVRADNEAAQSLYRHLGFEQLGVRTGYYQPDGVDAIIMRAPIPAPVTTLIGEAEHD